MSEETSAARIKATNSELSAWLASVARGDWAWARNTRCKYVTLHIDTREGAYRIEDRDGQQVSLEQLLWQYARAPSPAQKCGDEGAPLCAACSVPIHELSQFPGCGAPLPRNTDHLAHPPSGDTER